MDCFKKSELYSTISEPIKTIKNQLVPTISEKVTG